MTSYSRRRKLDPPPPPPAPPNTEQEPIINNHEFIIGQELDYELNDEAWYAAKVIQLEQDSMLLTFKRLTSDWDVWVECKQAQAEGKLAPLGTFTLDLNTLEPGQWVDIKDMAGNWYESMVVDVEPTQIKIVSILICV